MIKHNYDEAQKIKREIEKYKGLRSRQEATKLIIDVAPIKIYGQECAKKQCKAALSGCLENIYGNPSEIRGNVVYSINNEQTLGKQLFKTTTKSVNLKKDKNFRNLWGTLDVKENEEGSYDIRVASRMLQHIFNYCDCIVIIDEYDKMKQACRPADALEDYEDRTADEIIKSISDRGEYDVGNNKIDCRKTLFFITSNETKE